MIKITEGNLGDISNGNVGVDAQIIKYPGVYTCITVTGVLNDGRLVGTHLARSMSNDKVAQSLAHMVTLAGGTTFLSFYIVGMLSKNWSPPFMPKNYEWSNGIMAIAIRGALSNHTGNAWAFDTSGVAEIVDIKVSKVGAGTAGAFIDLKANDGSLRLLKVQDFIAI